jgi:hypothetical protein
MSITFYASGCMLDKAVGGINYTPPTSYFIGLSTTAISSSGSNATEPIGSAYARVEVPNTKSYFTYTSSGSLTNSGSITFPESSGSWGTVSDIAFYDALTSGNIWMYHHLTSPRIVQEYSQLYFDPHAINISMTT